MHADSTLGVDSLACCGAGDNPPCQTLNRSMQLIDSAAARDVTLLATVAGDAGGTWGESEMYPVVLGWGVELSAPGVIFGVTPAALLGSCVFEISAVSPSDNVGYVIIAGIATSPVVVQGELSTQVVFLDAGSSLYIANALLDDTRAGEAIHIEPASHLMLAQDRSGKVLGTVTIWGDAGSVGIFCEAPADGGEGCTISDAPLVGQSSLVLLSQDNDIQAVNGNISLTSAPILGVNPGKLGFGMCPSFEGWGIRVAGGTLTLAHGTIQCVVSDGLDIGDELVSLAPTTVTLSDTTIQNVNGTGIHAYAGTTTVSSSTIRFNAIGVIQDGDAVVDLSGGPLGGVNTVACNLSVTTPLVGYSVLNLTATELDARNVAWDTPGPDVWFCPPGTIYCQCESSKCIQGPTYFLDAKYVLDGGLILTTGNTLSTLSCD
jgi:hypothetical protein